MPNTLDLALFVFDERAACFRRSATAPWHSLPLMREQWMDVPAHNLAAVLKQINTELYRQSQLAEVQLCIVYDQAAASHLIDAPSTLNQLGCQRWQILSWERLLIGDRAAACQHDPEWLRSHALPILDTLFDGSLEGRRQAQRHALEGEEQAHQEKLRGMTQEIARLQAQVDALQLPSLEHLLVYLPAIFHNFWGSISPQDLALLAGSLQMPLIPSPHPEPSADTVATLKKRLLRLPDNERRKILAFSLELSHKLKVRAQMRDLLEASE